jgi:hypothetical protein
MLVAGETMRYLAEDERRGEAHDALAGGFGGA